MWFGRRRLSYYQTTFTMCFYRQPFLTPRSLPSGSAIFTSRYLHVRVFFKNEEVPLSLKKSHPDCTHLRVLTVYCNCSYSPLSIYCNSSHSSCLSLSSPLFLSRVTWYTPSSDQLLSNTTYTPRELMASTSSWMKRYMYLALEGEFLASGSDDCIYLHEPS